MSVTSVPQLECQLAETRTVHIDGSQLYTVWPEILAGNLFWRIGGFESNPPKTSQCDVIIIAKS